MPPAVGQQIARLKLRHVGSLGDTFAPERMENLVS
jgi:hypothetical protein